MPLYPDIRKIIDQTKSDYIKRGLWSQGGSEQPISQNVPRATNVKAPTTQSESDGGMPKRQKPNLMQYLIGVGLPAILGATSGVGMIPAALKGLGSMAEGQEEKYKTDIKAYEAGKSGEYRDAMTDLAKIKAERLQKKGKSSRGLGNRWSGILGNKKTISDAQYIRAKREAQKILDMGGQIPQDLKDIMDEYVDIKNLKEY